MAKVYGIQGNIVGKIANSVYAVVKGVNIVRAYNGSPANPQTSLQVASRARLKLLSQLTAAIAPIIAFKREGLKTARNVFVSKNYDITSFNSTTEVAEVDLGNVDLSGGLVDLPPIALVARDQASVTVGLLYDTDVFDFVIYGGVTVESNGKIMPIKPYRVNRQGTAPDDFDHVITGLTETATGFIYAVGYRLNDDASKAKYAQLTASGQNANILVSRLMTELNVTPSITRSVQFSAYQGA